VIGFLRFAGILNAAVWLGAAFFYAFAAGPGINSDAMEATLGSRNFPYYSVAILQVISERYFQLQLACSVIAVCHLVSEWLYLGKVVQTFWRTLLGGLVAATLVSGVWLQPEMKRWHHAAFQPRASVGAKEIAGHRFRTWQSVSEVVNLLVVSGLGVYLWRVANPADPTRFVSPAKFRS
jgi:hypothetical protein